MTAPVWIALPPEVHSAALSSGPGPGPLLASAAAWASLSNEYTDIADELSAVVAGVQTGAWEGPSADSYVAANAPYVAWLQQAAADSAEMAVQEQAAAAAYSSALAAMPTLVELAANHAIHGVLLATNFLGINTIPIALNEADYARMWVQAATTMSTYQAVSAAAVAAAPQTSPAPQIAKSDAASAATGLSPWDATLQYTYPVVAKIVEALGYNPPPLQVMENILAQYANGYPIASGTPLSQIEEWWAETFSGPGAIANAPLGQDVFFLYFNAIYLLPADVHAVLQGTPAQIFSFGTVAALFKQVIMTIGNVVGLADVALQNPAYLTPLLPLLTPGLAGAGGFAGLAGLAQQAAALPLVAAPPPVPATATPGLITAPTPSPAPTVPTAAPTAPTPVAAPQPPSLPPPGPAPPPPPANPAGFPYLVGTTTLDSRTSARPKTDEPLYRSGSKAPVAAVAATQEQAPVRRRRRARVNMLGRGYEYMDLEPDLVSAALASGQSAGTLGFTGTTPKESAAQAGGLARLADDGFGGAPRMPMMPGTWSLEVNPATDPGGGSQRS